MTASPEPLTFSDEQLLAALKVAPPQVQGQVALIAMQMELRDRREADEDEQDD